MSDPIPVFDFSKADIKTSYCIDLDTRDRQVVESLARIPGRLQAHADREGRIAVVCYGPSLEETWEQVRYFDNVITVSGAHKFLLDKGLTPADRKWWHCLAAGSIVETEDGPLKIKRLVENKYAGKVRSLDSSGRFVWSRVIGWSGVSSRNTGTQWVTVNFCAVGNKTNLLCTEDHRVAVLDDPLKPSVYYLEAGKLTGKWVVRLPFSSGRNHRENPLWNGDQVAVMAGIMLGDGNVKRDGQFRSTHGNEQRTYNGFKNWLFRGTIEDWDGLGFGKIQRRSTSRCQINAQSKYVRKLLYPNGVKTVPAELLKHVDARSLAFWYMDDGSLRKTKNRRPYALFCTDGFGPACIRRLIGHLKSSFGLEAQVCRTTQKQRNGIQVKGKYERIRLRMEDSEKLFALISPFVHPSMEYKLPEKFRNWPKYTFNNEPLAYSAEQVKKVTRQAVKRGKFHGGKLYDIEVEHTHNFSANNCIVHNCEVDPRAHKADLIGTPHKDIEYLVASVCHRAVFDLLEGYDVKLWHVFSHEVSRESVPIAFPRGDWAITGGSNVGLRAMVLARFLGFKKLTVFGMDYSFKNDGTQHAGWHPKEIPNVYAVEVAGETFYTNPPMHQYAQQFFKEVTKIGDIELEVVGNGMLQAQIREHMKTKPIVATPKKPAMIAATQPRTITPEYIDLNQRLHSENPAYGISGSKRAEVVRKLVDKIKPQTVLDYGCGKGTLAAALPFPIWEYDPCVPGKDTPPRPADLVICTDVLEHVEPECLDMMLLDLARCTLQVCYAVINTGPAQKSYADGRNAHLIQQPMAWWQDRLSEHFKVASFSESGNEVVGILGPKPQVEQKAATASATATAAPPLDISNRITPVRYEGTEVKFHTPNEQTQWRAKSLFTKEPSTIAWIDTFKAGEVFYDVGANIGGYSVWAAKRRGVKVLAFEPQAANYALLCRNLTLNAVDGTAYCVAVTQHIASMPGHLDKDVLFDRIYLSSEEQGVACNSFGTPVGPDLKQRESVAQGCIGIALDALVEELGVPDHIKIDVDGLEHLVIAGAANLLASGTVKSLLVEVNTNLAEHQAMLSSLTALGYVYDPVQVESSIRKEGQFKGCAEYVFQKPQPKEPDLPVAVNLSTGLLNTTPFPWKFTENVFPPELYAQMLANLPTTYLPIEHTRNVKGYPQRFTADIPATDVFWTNLFSQLRDGRLKRALCSLFGVEKPDNLTDECLLIRDLAGYSIGPHTDAAKKVITVLFYLPSDTSMSGAGTGIYTPVDEKFRCPGGPHYSIEMFNLLQTMPFLPNSAFMFRKTDNSFHGVAPCSGTRDVLLYDIRKK